MLDNRDGVLQNLISVIPFFILLNYRQRPYLTDSVITNDVGKNYILNSLHTLHPADDMHEYIIRVRHLKKNNPDARKSTQLMQIFSF